MNLFDQPERWIVVYSTDWSCPMLVFDTLQDADNWVDAVRKEWQLRKGRMNIEQEFNDFVDQVFAYVDGEEDSKYEFDAHELPFDIVKVGGKA